MSFFNPFRSKTNALKLYETAVKDVTATTGGAVLTALNGATQASPIDLLIRESIQNAYDARKDNLIPQYIFRAYKFSDQGKTEIRNCIAVDDDSIESNKLRNDLYDVGEIIEIADRNTTGLLGPYWQVDKFGNVIESEEKNYLGLVFATGQIKGKIGGAGGTTGVGKASYYISSSIHTVGFYTKVKISENGVERDETRFIISRVTDYKQIPSRFYFAGKNEPGETKDWLPKPLLNEDADKIASWFGLTGFEKGEYGTSIMILQPDFKLPTKENLEDYLSSKLTKITAYWFWPLILKNAIKITLNVFGKSLNVMDEINSNRIYRGYKELFYSWREDDIDSTVIKAHAPAISEPVGYIFSQNLVVNINEVPSAFRVNNYNCALAVMRNIDFVMRYDGFYSNAVPPGEFHIAFFHVAKEDVVLRNKGISKSVDEILRLSENQTHDKWIIGMLKDTNERSVVSAINTEIANYKNRLIQTAPPVQLRNISSKVSERLSRFMAFGYAPSIAQYPSANGAKPRRQKSKKLIQKPQPQSKNGEKRFRKDEDHSPTIEYAVGSDARTITIPYVRTKKTPDVIQLILKAEIEGSYKTEELPNLVKISKVSFSSSYTEDVNKREKIAFDDGKSIVTLSSPGTYYVSIRAEGPIDFDLTVKEVKS